MKSRKLLRVLTVILPLAAAILSALPNAVKLNFATPDETVVAYYSAFDMTPVGYAVWGAFGGAVGAIVLTVLAVVSLLKKDEELKKAMFTIAVIAAVVSLSTVILGNMTLTGGVITALLAINAGALYFERNYD